MQNNILDKEDPILLEFSEIKNINKFCFDGCYYYFTIYNSNKILQTDLDLNVVNCFEVDNIYNSICYDSIEKCFWVTIKSINNKIFSLVLDNHENNKNNKNNANHKNHKIININPDLSTFNSISNIKYNCCNNTIVVAYKNHLVELEKTGHKYNKIYYTSSGIIQDVISICPNYLVLVDSTNEFDIYNNFNYTNHTNTHRNYQKIYVLDENGKIFDYLDISHNINVKNLSFNPCYNDVVGVFLNYLINVSDNSQYLCSKNILFSEFERKACECNYNICDDSCCIPHDKPHPHPHPHPCPKIPPCDEVLESIALVEASIASILHAESCKLKKIIEETDDISLILETNKQVNKTIISVTNLEQILYNKLVTILEICECQENYK